MTADLVDSHPIPPPSGRGTLARQLVLRVVALVALIAVLLSLFTAMATRALLMGQLDGQLDEAKGRIMMGDIGLADGGPGQAPRGIQLPGQSVGTLALVSITGQTPRA
ncbi:MAG TPA: two-component sensor histidine kinase, partial [Microlunatus sp.]|nr:two-component sensor histidine kinase [Microlunatus sp.]